MSRLTIFTQWRSALVRENGEAYNFPGKFTRFMKDKYSMSAVYRWRVLRLAGDAKEPIYIGEAEDLIQRIQRVRTPSKKAKEGDTNRRLHDIFTKYLQAGRTIVLDIADIEPLEINGVRFGQETTGDRFKRRALENILLALAQKSEEFELLNVVVDPLDKATEKLLKLKPHQLREVLRKCGLGNPSRRTSPELGFP